jgi:hypothetical protein
MGAERQDSHPPGRTVVPVTCSLRLYEARTKQHNEVGSIYESHERVHLASPKAVCSLNVPYMFPEFLLNVPCVIHCAPYVLSTILPAYFVGGPSFSNATCTLLQWITHGKCKLILKEEIGTGLGTLATILGAGAPGGRRGDKPSASCDWSDKSCGVL